MSSSKDFNWGEEEAVIQQVDAVAVYENARSEIVIRQFSAMDEDSVIAIPRPYLERLIKALQEA